MKVVDPKRLQQLRDALLKGLVERDLPVRLALIATLAGEHLLMVGPPGTAKSLIARRLHLAFAKSGYFERLLTRFTVPEELFGPLSIKGLEEDRYERLTAAYLPSASIAFLDEIFKANSAILNSLLTLLNEREFDNGTRREKTPLLAVIGASNELPEGEELDALFDRFLLRVHVGSVSKEGFAGLIGLRGQAAPVVPESLKLTGEDVADIQAAAEKVDVPLDVVVLLSELREWCAAQSIQVSDRRWRKIVKLLQVSALTNGRNAVSIWDCWLLQHCSWSQVEDRVKIYEWYSGRVGASDAINLSQPIRLVVSWEGSLKKYKEEMTKERRYLGHPRAMPANAHRFLGENRNNDGKGYSIAELDSMQIEIPIMNSFSIWSGRTAYLADKGNWLVANTESALGCPSNVLIENFLIQIGDADAELDRYRIQVDHRIRTFHEELNSHLWVVSDFAEKAGVQLDHLRQEVGSLLCRVRRLKEGFQNLPCELGTEIDKKTEVAAF